MLVKLTYFSNISSHRDSMCFGQTLLELANGGFYNEHASVPYFVQETISFLSTHIAMNGLLVGGSSADAYNFVTAQIDAGTRNLQFPNIQAAADVLKNFLHKLRLILLPGICENSGQATWDLNLWKSSVNRLGRGTFGQGTRDFNLVKTLFHFSFAAA